jgi:formylmethanofuran dehydrogenase subunit E
MDYGIMAATFVNLETGLAFRVLSTEDARNLAPLFAPEVSEKYPRQLAAYRRMPDNLLFRVQEVRVDLSECDLPGPTRRKVSCSRCGQVVRDGREIEADGGIFCRPCAQGAYFQCIREIIPEDSHHPSTETEQGREAFGLIDQSPLPPLSIFSPAETAMES